VSELGSGWYLRGDVGWVDFSDPGRMPLGAGLPFDRVGLRETWSVGGGVGYQINSWFRADVTADWRNDAKFFGVNSGSNYVNGYSIDNGKIESSTLLLNGYIISATGTASRPMSAPASASRRTTSTPTPARSPA